MNLSDAFEFAQMTAREAGALLERARSFYAGRPRVLEHVNAAIHQISTALSIR